MNHVSTMPGPVIRSLFASILLVAAIVGARTAPAQASRTRPISELTRIAGQNENELIGLGIVIGLNGTGDDGQGAATRPIRELLKNLGNPVENINDLGESGAVAIVQVSTTIAAQGASEGDRMQVRVNTLFNATDLTGGQLVPSLLRPPVPDRRDLAPMAIASGVLDVSADNPTSGRIRRGGMMIADFRPTLVADGVMTLVLEPNIASHANAQAIADAINEPEGFGDEVVRIARVDESGTIIRITLPLADRSDPANFITDIQGIGIDASLLHEVARIVIDRENEIIVATNAVTVRPTAIALSGIRLGPTGDPGPWRPLGGGAAEDRAVQRLNELLANLDQLKVPVKDQIALIHRLHDAGAITAEIVDI